MAIFLFVTIGILVFLLIWLVFGSITIKIDTIRQEYSLNVVHILTLSPQWDEQGFRFVFQLPFYRFKIDPFEKSKPQKKKKAVKKKQAPPIKMNRIWSVLKSFKIRQFTMSIDTDDYCLNAMLVPLFQQLAMKGFPVNVNFQGENYCLLVIKNNLWRMGISYLKVNNS